MAIADCIAAALGEGLKFGTPSTLSCGKQIRTYEKTRLAIQRADLACAAKPYPSVVARETTRGADCEPRNAIDHEIVPYSATSRHRSGVGGIRKNRP